jgi:hypothetical protein
MAYHQPVARKQTAGYATKSIPRGDHKTAIKEEKETGMISKILFSLVALSLVVAIGGFAVLAAWDVPVQQTKVEKTLDTSAFLQKS